MIRFPSAIASIASIAAAACLAGCLFETRAPEPAKAVSARWTTVRKPVSSASFNFLSLAFREGRPAAFASRYGKGSYWLELDGEEWRQTDLPPEQGDTAVFDRWENELVSSPGWDLLVNAGPILRVRRLIAGQWYQALTDTAYSPSRGGLANAMEYHLGYIALASSVYEDSAYQVVFRQYEGEEGWARTEERAFRDYQLPGTNQMPHLQPGARHPAFAHRDGETAMVLKSYRSYGSGDSLPGMKLFRRRHGVWDSTPEFPAVSEPSLALEDGQVYMAFAERSGTESHPGFGRIHLRKYGASGWEEAGPPDIFGHNGTACVLKIRNGIPYVFALADGYQVARLAKGEWEILGQPGSQDFTQVLDFDVDEAGTPYLAVNDGTAGTRIIKYVDPHLP